MLGEDLVKFLAVVVAGSLGVTARELTGDEYSRLPKLFHLDDFDTCLMQSKGLYCLGSFHVKPLNYPDPTYELMKEYSSDPHHFNRTLLHRGYCVSSRCPWITDRTASLTDRNASLTGRKGSRRFERCASFYSQRSGLRAQLTELSYCRSHAQDVALKDISSSVETPHRVFLYVVGAIAALNVIGTVYDVWTTSDRNCKLLSSWSLVSNWQQLVGPSSGEDPRLATHLPVDGFRVMMILLVILVHDGCLHVLFLQNPKYVEEIWHHPVLLVVQNGSSYMQMFILLSNFLLADSLLNMPQPPSFSQLPKITLKRIFRIAPAYVLVISFAATWWPLVGNGPMWPMLVGRESELCKRKFWPNVFFLQNFVEPEQNCLWQTWFLAVDMQLHVVGCISTLLLCRCRRRLALPLLGAGFLLSVALNSYRAYVNQWKPLMFVSTPEQIRTKFRTTPSFSEFYTSPMGSLPTCLLGLFMAHLLHHLRDKGFKPADHKWLIVGCLATIPLLPAWTCAGCLVHGCSSRASMALYIALDRPVLTLLAAVLLFGTY